jgi:hypothetical protein
MLREIWGSLFGRSSASAEEVVFERLDESGLPVDTPPGVGRSVPVEKILGRVPAAWRRDGEPPVHEVLILSDEALLPGSAPGETRYSLRYLTRFYPSMFRDPGVMVADPGVSIPREHQADPAHGLVHPETGLSALPAETVLEVVKDPATFSVWEGDRITPSERQQELRETRRALSKVRLPAPSGTLAGGFEASLSQSISSEEMTSSAQAPAPETGSAPAAGGAIPALSPTVSIARDVAEPRPVAVARNMRLRRILEAYAETLPEYAAAAGAQTAVPAPEPGPSAPRGGASGAGAISGREEGAGGVLHKDLPVPEGDPARQTRWSELGAAMARFLEVEGFAVWEGGRMAYSGRLGFAPEQSGVLAWLENLLGAGDPFGVGKGAEGALTFQSTRGEFAVFWGEKSLVFVALRAGAGVSDALRIFFRKWVAQAVG